MQKELYSDIEESNLLIGWAEQEDKYAIRIIESTKGDSLFEKNNYLFNVGTQTYPLIVTDVAFKKLTEFNGSIPEKYDKLINEMYQLYIEEKNYTEEVFERLNDYTLDSYNKMYANHSWMVDLENKNITPEIINYFQENRLYKSHIYRYKNLLYELGQENVIKFKVKAILLFYK